MDRRFQAGFGSRSLFDVVAAWQEEGRLSDHDEARRDEFK